jgi:hypothetical protein
MDSAAKAVGERGGLDMILTWDKVETDVRDLTALVASFDETQFVDVKTDPQPRR